MMDGNSLKTLSSSASSTSSSSTVSAPPFPPAATCLDLYGKRRQLVKIQILEREIGLLQEELKSVDELQPASRCCKELNDFVAAKVDPLLALNKEETHKSNLCWKKLCYLWICCFSGCGTSFKMPKCCSCSQICDTNMNLCSCMKNKMGCKNCCKCSCGVSCPVVSCCCFNTSFCNCKNHCCNCSIPCSKTCCCL